MDKQKQKYFSYRGAVTVLFIFFISTLHAQTIQFPGGQDSLYIYNFNGSEYKGSSYNYTIVEDEDGIVYFGNENGLLEFDGARWKLHQNYKGSAVTNIKIVEDKFYVTDGLEFGYFQRDPSGEMKYHTLYVDEAKSDTPNLYNIHTIYHHKGNIYFMSYEKTTVYDGEVFKTIEVENAHVFEVGGELLFSVYEKGLAKLQGDTLFYVNTDFKFKEDAAFVIEKDFFGQWLIYTSEEGIYKFDTATYKTELWKSEMTDYFKRDDRDFYNIKRVNDTLFVTHTWDHGIVFFNDKAEFLLKVDKEDGLNHGLNFKVHVDRRGNIWLINAYGIHYLNWGNLANEYKFEPQTIIRSIAAEDSTIHISKLSQLVFFEDYKNKSITFNFATPSFLQEELEYSYYLEGFEDNFSNWTQQSSKEYTNLTGGDYQFKVKARYPANPEIEIAPFYVNIAIDLPWYENKWNYLYFVLIAAGLVIAFIRIRTQRLKGINKKLEELVNERTSQLLQQQVQLQEANDELKVINNELDNFVYRSSHDLVAPLKSLRGLIQIAQHEKSEEERAYYFQLMNTSINKLEEFIKSIMDFSTNSKKPLEFKEVRLNDILDSIVQDIKYYTNSEKVELRRNFEEDFVLETDAKRLHIILSNLVTNAVKYHNYDQDDQPYIEIQASKKEKHYELVISDNGQGIPEEYHEKIFDMFFRAHQGSEGSGLGLYIVIDTLKMLQGKIDFKSKLRTGTTFKLDLPLQKYFF